VTRVLLADDHPFMRAGVEAVLRGSKFTLVATAANGDDAWAALAEHDPDICIFDIRMPGRSGVELLETMRARGDRRPVVLLTAELEDTALIAAVRAGVNGIVLKDGAEDALLASLEAVAGGRRAVPAELLQRAVELSLEAPSQDPLSALTPRECQIAEHVGRGLRNKEIAAALGMSEGTVKVYLHAMYQKLGIENRTELALLTHGRPAVSRSVPSLVEPGHLQINF
jgi:two-component system, NarL family, nitrate/nitrite response regulator NarL